VQKPRHDARQSPAARGGHIRLVSAAEADPSDDDDDS
jgi:hypothetical protein